MEVHHHPEVEKKGFKEYVLEGLMIFLSVTMGFFAESIRESIGDNAKEHEYITSMIEDARKDTAAIHWCIRVNSAREKAARTLANMCYNYDVSKSNDAILYIQFHAATYHPDYVYPVERTLTQLKNSGGMRLIRKKAAVDSIIAYEDETKKLVSQQGAYQYYLNNWEAQAEQIFNLKYLHIQNSKQKISASKPGDTIYNGLLFTRDKMILAKAGNSVSTYGAVVDFYVYRLKETEVHSVNLIHTLQKEYHLKE
jgi:hypothetical protein